jgi:gamma-glutamyltranspeptidase/glutathione hydrolase
MKALARRGMVASPHYLATGAGVSILRRGGTAVDAAIATNAVLAVVYPHLCGIGGDLFAQVYTPADGTLAGLNGSGRAPRQATPERVRALAGADSVPARGPLPITVPGCVEAWGTLHRRYGRLPFRDLLADAITYARDGFPVTASFSHAMRLSAPFLHPDTPALETFLPNGEPPAEGQIVVQSRIARTLKTIAEEGPEVYYRGPIADEIARSVRAVGGLLSTEDLAEHHSDWVEPLSLTYRGVTVYELPPSSQGIVALMILNILNHLPEEPIRQGGAEYIHLLAEAARLAYADRAGHLTDPLHMTVETRSLLSDRYAADRACLIGQEATPVALAGTPGDTIYLCTADGDGNLVSLIESNFMGIGSGVMAGETGVMLQNRGHWFSLDPHHANVIAPGKRTLHTLMPGMAFKGARPWLVFGSMGGSAQAQIHVELLTRKIDHELPVDETIAAPRFDAVAGINDKGYPLIQMENRFPAEILAGIQRRGHCPHLLGPHAVVGHAHMIELLDNGAYAGAADPRADSLALGY